MSEVPTPAEAFIPRLPHPFGDYELLEEIGRGGMGVIFKARQAGLNRLCAIKMLHHQGAFGGPRGEEMLRQEAAAAASLDHAHIVGIYEAGREQGRLYFSMEYVAGVNLTGFTRDRIVSAEEVATLTRTMAEAIAYAHSKGVWHHDLKPANVLIDDRGWPQITDFGLARRVGDAQRADPGAGAGSPNYLAPEQASDRFGEPGPRTDVFGLGAILYFLLTDRPPFRGESVADTLRAVIESDPVRPRILRSGVPDELETICLRCLEKRPSQRYATPQELADDLGRFLRHEPVQARPAGPVLRARKWCRRHPVVALLSSIIVCLLVSLAVGSFVAAVRIRRERDVSRQARQQAELSEREARRELYANDLQRAFESNEANDVRRAEELLLRQIPTNRPGPPRPDLRGWEWYYLRGATRSDELRRTRIPVHLTDFVRLSDPPRLLLARVDGNLQTLSLPELRPGELQPVLPGTNIWQLLAISADRQRLAVAAADAARSNTVIRVSHTADSTEIARFTVPGSIGALEIGPSPTRPLWLVEVRTEDTTVHQRFVERALPDGAVRREFTLPTSRRWPNTSISPDGRWLATAQDDASIALWNLQTKELHHRLEGHFMEPGWIFVIYGVRFSPDSRRLLTTGADKTARLWSVVDGRLLTTFTGNGDVVGAAEFLPGGEEVVTASRDGTLRFWSAADGRELTRLRGAGAEVGGLLIAEDGTSIHTLDAGGLVRTWPREPSGSAVTEQPLPRGHVWAELLAGTRHWWSCSDSLDWTLGSVGTAQEPRRYAEQNAANIRARSYCPATETIGNYQRNGILRLTPLAGGSERELVGGPPAIVATTRFSPSGRWVAVGIGTTLFYRPGETNQVCLWNVADGSRRHRFEGPSEILAFSPDEHGLAGADSSGHVTLWDLTSGQARVLTGHSGQVPALGFSPDGRQLATGSSQGGARVWNTATGALLADLPVPGNGVLSVTFTPDGTRLLTGGLDGAIHLWDLQSQRSVGALRGHHRGVTSLAFRDRETLVSLGLDEIRTWHVLSRETLSTDGLESLPIK